MPYSIKSPQNSFIQFSESDETVPCAEFENEQECLPVFSENDIWFQFTVETDTEEEADVLCGLENDSVQVGIANTRGAEFEILFADKPNRYRIGQFKVLYTWQYGLPGFQIPYEVGECFVLRIEVEGQDFYSNCMQRIGDICHTSVIEYYGDENQFGFNYCASDEAVQGNAPDCAPTIIEFTNQDSMAIPWTEFLRDKYGNTPDVQVWERNDNGEYIIAGTVIAMDSYPPNEIRLDFGGTVSGFVKIMK